MIYVQALGLRQEIESSGGHLPRFVRQEFEDYLKCGLLEHGFLRVKCDGCFHEHLVAFSCKHRGFCPSCDARRMVESGAHLVDHVFPEVAVRQWVLTFPLRFLLAARRMPLPHYTERPYLPEPGNQWSISSYPPPKSPAGARTTP